MKPQWFMRRRQWGRNAPDNRDFFTTWLLVCLCVLSLVVVCQI